MKASKEQILVAIRKGKGIVTSVCQQLGISRQAFYLRANKDEEIFEALQEAREEIIDFAETKLIQLIGDGNANAIFFYLKTVGKGRGYIEKQEIEQTSKTINIIEVPQIDASEPTIDEIREKPEH
jgi:hypothetical protein|tara:strand:- start:1518 stop:1892 length:375 start_codon:yes stop_codon:yes gene_type:complete